MPYFNSMKSFINAISLMQKIRHIIHDPGAVHADSGSVQLFVVFFKQKITAYTVTLKGAVCRIVWHLAVRLRIAIN